MARSFRSGRRSPLSITADILMVLFSLGPTRKTKLMNLANLNTKSFEHYASQLRKRMLISNSVGENSRRSYRITSLGIRVLQAILFADEVLNIPEQSMTHVAEVKRSIVNIVVSRNMRVEEDVGITGVSGIVHYHDLVVRKGSSVTVVDVVPPLGGDTLVVYTSLLLLSCLDTGVPHVVVAQPQTFHIVSSVASYCSHASVVDADTILRGEYKLENLR